MIEQFFWNSRLKAENLQNFWDHLDNLVKGKVKYEKKILGFRNLQEKLENIMSVWNIAWDLICYQSIRHESLFKKWMES